MDYNCNEFYSLFIVTLSCQILKNDFNFDLDSCVYGYCKLFFWISLWVTKINFMDDNLWLDDKCEFLFRK